MAMTDAKPVFIDTNALIYANVMGSSFHIPALEALIRAHHEGRPMWISRQVLREYLVTMTRPQSSFTTPPKETVLEQVVQFCQRFHVADDTPAVTEQLVSLMGQHDIGGKRVHDTNIVATMLAYDIPCLLTHNIKDFARFGEIIAIEPVVKEEG
jgi:predicted nucleic acid-binding protein